MVMANLKDTIKTETITREIVQTNTQIITKTIDSVKGSMRGPTGGKTKSPHLTSGPKNLSKTIT